VQYARVNPWNRNQHFDLGRHGVTGLTTEIDAVRDVLAAAHPEVDWAAVAAAPTGDVIVEDISDALLDAGCDPAAVAAFIADALDD
jgi:hypothetical protein